MWPRCFESAEPPTAANPLLAHPQALVTPHIAWATDEARARLRVLVDNLRAWQAGRIESNKCLKPQAFLP